MGPEERRRVVLVARGVRRDFWPSQEALQPVEFLTCQDLHTTAIR